LQIKKADNDASLSITTSLKGRLILLNEKLTWGFLEFHAKMTPRRYIVV
jgi:hypothetical protein